MIFKCPFHPKPLCDSGSLCSTDMEGRGRPTMFTPKAPSITTHGHSSPHHHCTAKQCRGRMEPRKAKGSEDTTWSPLQGNPCTGCHLLTSLQSQCMYTAGLVLFSNQLLLYLCSTVSSNGTWLWIDWDAKIAEFPSAPPTILAIYMETVLDLQIVPPPKIAEY